MEVFYSSEISVPLSTSYIGDPDLKFTGTQVRVEDGFNIFVENYLLSAVDSRINNFNALYLTGQRKNNDILDINHLEPLTQFVFSTIIKSNSNGYLTISQNMTDYMISLVNTRFSTFEFEKIGDIYCRIAFQNNFERYYLNFNGSLFYFSSEPNFINDRFNFILEGNSLYLFTSRNGVIQSITTDSTNLMVADLSTWKQNAFNVNSYIQNITPDVNSAWVSYDLADKNALEINPSKSRLALSNNSLVYNNYTYITGGEIQSNIITLKNQHSHKNYSYRADNTELTNFTVPNVSMRSYTSLNTGVEQELGADSITLTYEFYNADYKLKADNFTIFNTPKSLYPYKQLNVKDSLLTRNGAIGGTSPYTADKIFFRDTRPGFSDGQYICTWLSAFSPDQEGIWVDRYYIPERTSYAAAITATSIYTYTDPVNEFLSLPLPVSAYYDAPYMWSGPEEEKQHTPQTLKDVLIGQEFFDKRSDLAFLPDQEYIYQRIGNKYVTSILNTLTSSLIRNQLELQTTAGADIVLDVDADSAEYVLDGNSFALVEDFVDINKTKQSTISFWMASDDWKTKFGHQIIGNYNDRGFGVVNDSLITPIITVQNGRTVQFLNTDFVKIDTIYQSQQEADTQYDIRRVADTFTTTTFTYLTAFFIKDLFRIDHLDFCSPIISTYTDCLTSIKSNSILPSQEQNGLLLYEDGNVVGFLAPDNAIDTSLTPVSGILLEPQSAPGSTLLPYP